LPVISRSAAIPAGAFESSSQHRLIFNENFLARDLLCSRRAVFVCVRGANHHGD
jgi:hypothetical protein